MQPYPPWCPSTAIFASEWRLKLETRLYCDTFSVFASSFFFGKTKQLIDQGVVGSSITWAALAYGVAGLAEVVSAGRSLGDPAGVPVVVPGTQARRAEVATVATAG